MASIKVNVVANVAGKAWAVLASFLFVPLYIKYLGIEQYSLISFSLVLYGILHILDGGLTLTLSREFALSRSIEDKWKTFRILENCYLYIVVIIILMTIMGADFIATSWLKLDTINSTYAANCIRILGCSCGLQMLSSFYSGGFTGLERMVEMNGYRIVSSLIRAGLVVVPVAYTHSVFFFFAWQFVSDLLYALFLRIKLKPNKIMPKVSLLTIEKKEVERVGKFAGGVFLISVIAAVNTQLDKIVISKIFEISELGIYTLAMTAAMGVISLTSPITAALQPRFTKLISEKKNDEVIRLYSLSFLFVSQLTLAISFVLSLNSFNILWVWTGDTYLAEKASVYLPILMIGAVAIAYQTIPYCIAIGNGCTRYNNFLGIASLLLTIPGYLVAGKHWGPKGVAYVYAISQMLITPIYIYCINKRFLGQLSSMSLLLKSVLLPGLVIGLLSFALSLIPIFNNRLLDLLRFLLIGSITLAPAIINIWKLNKKNRLF